MTHSGGQPHNVGDKGQRFEVTYHDKTEKMRKVFGWSATPEGAEAISASIRIHPNMEGPIVKDRNGTRVSYRARLMTMLEDITAAKEPAAGLEYDVEIDYPRDRMALVLRKEMHAIVNNIDDGTREELEKFVDSFLKVTD